MATYTNFPVGYGSAVRLHCKEGSVLKGDYEVLCREGAQYFYENASSCEESNGKRSAYTHTQTLTNTHKHKHTYLLKNNLRFCRSHRTLSTDHDAKYDQSETLLFMNQNELI